MGSSRGLSCPQKGTRVSYHTIWRFSYVCYVYLYCVCVCVFCKDVVVLWFMLIVMLILFSWCSLCSMHLTPCSPVFLHHFPLWRLSTGEAGRHPAHVLSPPVPSPGLPTPPPGHLDTMRLLDRAFRRAALPLSVFDSGLAPLQPELLPPSCTTSRVSCMASVTTRSKRPACT